MTNNERTSSLAPHDPVEAFIRAAAELLALPVEPGWIPGVRDNLLAAWALAEFVSAFPLPDGAEPAPRYDLEHD